MAGVLPLTLANSVASSGTSDVAEVSGLTQGPACQVYISSAALVTVQQSHDRVIWTSLVAYTASATVELDPRGTFYRFIWSGNIGTVAMIVGAGFADGELANVKNPLTKSTPPS